VAQVFYKDGSAVPEDKIAEAVASGAAMTKSDRIAVKDAKGNLGTIDASELGHPGYTVLTDQEIAHEKTRQERGTLGEQGITALEGAARGASAGLSDVALGGLFGKDYTRAARERKEVNPLTSTGFEIGGAIAPALFTGGASAEAGLVARGAGAARLAEEGSALSNVARAIPSNLISRAGSFAERGAARLVGEGAESALGRMAQRAIATGAQGAVEGGLYGAGMAASEATLNDAPITAEKLLSGFGHGALFGGGAGAGLGAVGGGLSKIIGSGTVREGAEALANKSALEAAGFGAGDLKRLASKTGRTTEQAAADLGPELLSYKFESGPLAGKKLFTGAKRAEDFVDDLALARQEVDGKVSAMREGAEPDLNAYFQRVHDEVLAPLRASPSALAQREAKQVVREITPLLDRASTPGAAPVTMGELEQVARDLKTALPGERGKQAATILDQEIDAAVARNLEAKGIDPASYTKQKKTLDALTEIEGVAQKASEAKGTNPQDIATGLQMAIGAMLTGNVGGLALGAASALGRKLIKERGQSVLAVMADNVARMDGRITEAAQALAGAPRKAAIVGRTSPDVGRFDDTAEAVRQFQQDPVEGQKRLAKPVEHIAPVHPQLAAQMQQTLAGDYDYLASKLPPVMTRADSSLTPQAEKGRVPAAQKAKFMETVQALENPAGVIERVANGELPQAQIDALKVRRPEIYQQMRTEVIKAFSTAKKPASFLERTRVSLAFEFNGDASLDPQTLKQIQSTNRNAVREPDQPATPQNKPAPGTSPKNLDKDLATSMTLPADKAAVGG
jgi:hypothetical protein